MQKQSSPDTTHLHPGEHLLQQEGFVFGADTLTELPIGETNGDGVGGGV